MPKHLSKKKGVGGKAFAIVQQAAGQSKESSSPPTKNPAAVELGRLGGLKGGVARAIKLSPDERKAIAKKAAFTRWRNKN
jgi:hypothetical protein